MSNSPCGIEDLRDHPEGGRFREVFRSARTVIAPSGEPRTALTHIYFALEPGEISRLHRVASDEVWNLYRGAVRLHCWEGGDAAPTAVTLAPDAEAFCHVVPAGTWQAAEPIGGAALVGCSVAPGFEFADFELMQPGTDAARGLLARAPELERFVAGP